MDRGNVLSVGGPSFFVGIHRRGEGAFLQSYDRGKSRQLPIRVESPTGHITCCVIIFIDYLSNLNEIKRDKIAEV